MGSIKQFADEAAARQAVTALHLNINPGDVRVCSKPLTLAKLVDHYHQRELKSDTVWKTYSTKVTYQGYIQKWIMPRWGRYLLSQVSAGEVEQWLRSLPLARSSCAKIRNIMSVLFNHGMRHEICNRNPIRFVRQSAKRRNIPRVLSVSEIQRLTAELAFRERVLVELDVGTGLRMSELFALKWSDVDFQTNEISVTRSIVMQVVGPCKTEASQKSIPLDPYLAEILQAWRRCARYCGPDDWVFANPDGGGRKPYWGQSLLRKFIRPIAIKLGIPRFGWHTFRHTYSTLLKATNADIKVMQELLRHASSRVTLDTYTQAITSNKRKAQSEVVRLLRASNIKAS